MSGGNGGVVGLTEKEVEAKVRLSLSSVWLLVDEVG
jgi:hypothetical protein